MHDLILSLEKDFKKTAVVAVHSGDMVKITQRIKEASKERLQSFEGLVIRVDRANSLTYRITMRKITSGVEVEKSFLLHSPNVVRVEVLKRAKVRRNYLSYMRQRVGKSARLKSIDFDKKEVNKHAQIETLKAESVKSETEVETKQAKTNEDNNVATEDGKDSINPQIKEEEAETKQAKTEEDKS